MSNTLVRLQRWYLSNCNNEWEHAFGVHIDTLDNPGWIVRIDLMDTPLASRPFDRIEVGEQPSNYDDAGRQLGPWWTCWVDDSCWCAACGPESLEQALGVFLDWAGF